MPDDSGRSTLKVFSLRWWPSTLFLASVIGLWTLVAATNQNDRFGIPSPLSVTTALLSLLLSGTFWGHALISLIRVCIGSLLAVGVGFPLGLWAGYVQTADRALTPLMSFLRYIPPTSFLTLLIVYFGIGEGYKIAVVCLGVVFFAYQLAFDAIRTVDPRYFEIAITAGMSRRVAFWHVGVRGAVPNLFDSSRIILSGGWTFLVAAEVVGSASGLGFFINQAQRFLRISELYAAILLIGVIGIASDHALTMLRRRFTPWLRGRSLA